MWQDSGAQHVIAACMPGIHTERSIRQLISAQHWLHGAAL